MLRIVSTTTTALLLLAACEQPGKTTDAPDTTDTIVEQPNTDPMIEALYEGGGFAQINTDLWIEANVYGSFRYTEDSRGGWDVTLSQADGVEQVIIDYEARLISFGDTERPFHTASSPVFMERGWVVTRAAYDGGAFVQLSESLWVENSADGTFTFEEQRRDGWTIYLYDGERGRTIELDCWTGEIFSRPDSDEMYTLIAEIRSTEADALSGWSMREVTTDAARYTQHSDTQWIAYAGDDEVARYQELGRDEWSVYLQSEHSSAGVQLDLYRDEVITDDENIPVTSAR